MSSFGDDDGDDDDDDDDDDDGDDTYVVHPSRNTHVGILYFVLACAN